MRLLTLLVVVAVAAAAAAAAAAGGVRAQAHSAFFATAKFRIVVTAWRNGGNNTADGATPVQLEANTVTDDFAYFKARVGVKLQYIPEDCTPWSELRPRLPFDVLTRPVDPNREPDPRCGYTTYTDRLRVFDAKGVELHDLHTLEDGAQLLVVPPGDLFVWPGWYIGHRVTLDDVQVGGRAVVLETVSLEPRIFVMEQFVTPEETEAIIAAARPNMIDSMGFVDGSHKKIAARNSDQAWLACDGSKQGTQLPLICDIDARVSRTMRLDAQHANTHGEAFQVIHYEPGEHYHAHYDWFDATLHPNTPGLKEGFNRFSTLLFYLSDVDAGGATVFPRAGDNGYTNDEVITDFSDCKRGIVLEPRRLSAVLWYNMKAPGNSHEGFVDPLTLHGGCDVTKGEKWAANKWVHNRMWTPAQDEVRARVGAAAAAAGVVNADESGTPAARAAAVDRAALLRAAKLSIERELEALGERPDAAAAAPAAAATGSDAKKEL